MGAGQLEETMELAEIVRTEQPENRHLAYVSQHTGSRRIVERLVGMANGEGGTVVVGVHVGDDGVPSRVEDVECRETIAREVEEVATERVEGALEYRVETFEVESKRLVGFTAPPGNGVRSHRDECVEKPVFPVRRRTELEYLTGRDLSQKPEPREFSSRSRLGRP